MNLRVLRGLSTAATLAGAAALFGCGGGGSGSMTGTVTPVDPPQMPEPPAPTLAIPVGMTASTASGVTARSAGDTIAALLPQPGRQFAPVSARSRMDEFHVKTIASDGNNGFRVTYVVAGQERTVHFEAAMTTVRGKMLRLTTTRKPPDGGRFWLNSIHSAFLLGTRRRTKELTVLQIISTPTAPEVTAVTARDNRSNT